MIRLDGISNQHGRRILLMQPDALEVGGADGPRQYGGGYLDYVAETGYEAPGVR